MLYILPRVVLQVKASLYYKTINNKNKKTYFILPRGGCLFLRGVRSSLRVRVGAGSALPLAPRTAEGGRQLCFLLVPSAPAGRAAAFIFWSG